MKLMEKLRRHRHIFLIMVLFLAVCGVIPAGMPEVAYATLSTDPNDPSGNTYLLGSREDIFEMVDMIGGIDGNNSNYNGSGYVGSGNPNANFRMTGDIDMSGGNSNPSGPTMNNNTAYTGTFDGGGYTISNLYIYGGQYGGPNPNDFDNIGLFRQTDGATIKDVTFADCNVQTPPDSFSNCGLVAGSMTDTNVENVSIKNSTVDLGAINNNPIENNIGILAGSINGGSVSNVKISDSEIKENDGTVDKRVNNVGVLAGSMDGTTLQGNTISNNSVNINPNHQVDNVKTGNDIAGTATNVTVINPSQQSNPTSGNSDPEPTALPTEAPEPTLSPATTPEETTEPEPTIAPKPSATPLPKGTKFEEGENKFRALGGTKVGYAGTTEEGEAHVEIPDTVEDENGIEYKVTRILKNAFKGEETLKDITFGQYIEVVEDSAFKDCTSLTKMETSPVLRRIEQSAFLNCEHLQNVKLPTTVVYIGDKAFKNCKSMREFILGDESRETKAADPDSKLDTINISIGASVFSGCQNLRRVVINIQVTVIGNSAFANCTKLTDIEVYSKVLKTVGDSALKGVHDCKIAVVKVRLKKYKKLFQNRGQGKKVVVAKM